MAQNEHASSSQTPSRLSLADFLLFPTPIMSPEGMNVPKPVHEMTGRELNDEIQKLLKSSQIDEIGPTVERAETVMSEIITRHVTEGKDRKDQCLLLEERGKLREILGSYGSVNRLLAAAHDFSTAAKLSGDMRAVQFLTTKASLCYESIERLISSHTECKAHNTS